MKTIAKPAHVVLAERVRAAVTAATKAPEPASVTRLRKSVTPVDAPPTVAQVQAIVDGLQSCLSLADVAKAAQLPADRVLTVVAGLGTFLRHTREVPEFTLVKARELAEPPLFQTEPENGNTQVVIPTGWERSGSGQRRDVTKALGVVVASRPTEAELTRWVARQQPADFGLDFSVVTMTWFFARIGRLAELDEINPGHAPLARSLVAAWDLLDGGRRRALAALVSIAETGTVTDAHLAAIRPIWEGRAMRLEQLMAHGSQALAREALSFTQQVLGDIPASVAELNQGQIRRLAQAAGLVTEAVARSEESEIRAGLEELGLGADADHLVHEGVSALKRGLLEEFWDAARRRANGDPDWREPLEADTDL